MEKLGRSSGVTGVLVKNDLAAIVVMGIVKSFKLASGVIGDTNDDIGGGI